MGEGGGEGRKGTFLYTSTHTHPNVCDMPLFRFTVLLPLHTRAAAFLHQAASAEDASCLLFLIRLFGPHSAAISAPDAQVRVPLMVQCRGV